MTAAPQRPPVRRLAITLIGLSFALLVLLSHHALTEHLYTWDLNTVRLERSFVLAAGEAIFAAADQGLVLNTIYGPIGAVAFLPATLAPTLTAALHWGQRLAMLYVLLPILLLHLGGMRVGACGRQRSLLAFACFWALALDLWCLEYVTFTIHVDAPALGLGALACAGLLFRHRIGTLAGFVISALAAVLAVWTKQVMVPLLVALPLYLCMTEGWRVAWRYGRVLVVIGLVISGLMILLFGPFEVLWLNLVTVPSQHPWRGAGGFDALLFGAKKLVVETMAAWVLALVALALQCAAVRARQAPGDADAWWRTHPATLCWTVAVLMVPTALLGRLKVGGDANTVSYVAYFLLAGATLMLRDLARYEGVQALPRLVRRGLGAVLALLLFTLLGVQERGALTPWRTPWQTVSLAHEVAYHYSQQHPGEVYFPRLTLASYLGEGQFYHQSVGLIDRQLAGYSVDAAHLSAHLPPRLRAVAFHRNGTEGEMRRLPLTGFSRVGTDPALPGFVVYRRDDDVPDELSDDPPIVNP